MSDFQFSAEIRTDLGKAACRRMRRLENTIPAVVYGAKEEPTHITLPGNVMNKALENEAFYSSILTLVIAGKKTSAVVRDVQRHPYKPKIEHMDFMRVDAKQEITMTIPVHFVGEDVAPGAKEGGVFTHNIAELEIRCLPANLPEFIEVDVSKMKLDDVIHISELKAPKGVEILEQAIATDHAHDHAVVSIHIPHVAAEPEELEATETLAAADEAAESEQSEDTGSSDEEKPAEE